jgi:hypothetical protein
MKAKTTEYVAHGGGDGYGYGSGYGSGVGSGYGDGDDYYGDGDGDGDNDDANGVNFILCDVSNTFRSSIINILVRAE